MDRFQIFELFSPTRALCAPGGHAAATETFYGQKSFENLKVILRHSKVLFPSRFMEYDVVSPCNYFEGQTRKGVQVQQLSLTRKRKTFPESGKRVERE